MGYVAVKMNQAQEVQTHGWGQSTQHHASKHEAELVRLVMRGDIVQVEYSDLEYAVVRTETEVGNSQNGGQLNKYIVIVVFSSVDEHSKQGQDGVLDKEQTL